MFGDDMKTCYTCGAEMGAWTSIYTRLGTAEVRRCTRVGCTFRISRTSHPLAGTVALPRVYLGRTWVN